MAHAEYKGIGIKGQAKFRLYYDGPRKAGRRNQLKESFAIFPPPEKAAAIIKAAENRSNGSITKTEALSLERFEKKAFELADLEARKKEGEINDPNYIEPVEIPKETFRDLADRWLKFRAGTARKGKKQPKTMLRYEQLIERLNEFLGDYEVHKINTDAVEECYAWLSIQTKKPGKRKETSDKKPKTLSSQTIWHHHRCLYSILEYGIERKLLDSNPCKYVRPPEIPEGIDEKKPDAYNEEQTARIQSLIENESLQHKILVTIALEIGPRAGEIQALKWSDIDFNTRMVNICKSWQYIKGKGSFEKPTKNKSSNRTVRLSANTIFLLRQLKGEQEAHAIERGSKWIDSGAVFTAWNGKQVNAMFATCWWRQWIRKTDLPIKTLHSLRHTCISLLINAGANPLEVARMVGHSNAEMLWRIYGHAVQKESFNGADIMHKIMNKKPSKKVEQKVEQKF